MDKHCIFILCSIFMESLCFVLGELCTELCWVLKHEGVSLCGVPGTCFLCFVSDVRHTVCCWQSGPMHPVIVFWLVWIVYWSWSSVTVLVFQTCIFHALLVMSNRLFAVDRVRPHASCHCALTCVNCVLSWAVYWSYVFHALLVMSDRLFVLCELCTKLCCVLKLKECHCVGVPGMCFPLLLAESGPTCPVTVFWIVYRVGLCTKAC